MTPSLTLRETYDDNVYFRDVDDYEHLISPALELGARTERGEVKARGVVDISEYQDHDELDSVDQTYGLSGRMSTTPWLQLNFSGEYVDDYTFVSALEESGLVAERSRRKRTTLEPGMAFAVDPRNTLAVSYGFSQTRYRLEEYPDHRGHGLYLTWYHDLMNERTRLIGVLGGDQVEYDRDDEDLKHQTLLVLAGFEHQLGETWQVTLKAGGRYTESEFPRTELVFVPPFFVTGKTVTEKEYDTGFIMDGTLEWRLERLTASADLSREFSTSIYGENMMRDRVRAHLRFQMTEKLRLALSAAYYQSETDGLIQKEEYQTFAVRPWVIYRITDSVDLHCGYSYTWTENEITSRSEDRNRFFVELSMAWPQQL